MTRDLHVAHLIVAGNWDAVRDSLGEPSWQLVFAVWYHQSGLGAASRAVSRAWVKWRREQLKNFFAWKAAQFPTRESDYNQLFSTTLIVYNTLKFNEQIRARHLEEAKWTYQNLICESNESAEQARAGSTETEPRQRYV